ncbi:MAG: carboxypeptidase-like regulatory domain-containing protein [Muribaculaceae bacterium]|nr:carboxypeptidase-like regulatory domain-containing protein [Muribaculaceae bacterium]
MQAKLKIFTCEKLRKAAMLLALLAAPTALFAADVTVSGTVSGDGEPLIGASVFQTDKNTNAVVTDYDGNYSIKLPENAYVTF